jgi:hypothetical protein
VVDSSYVFSKLFTDAESAWGNNSTAFDAYNRRLDKTVSTTDRTHDFKLNYVYDLPIGPGKRWLAKGIVSKTVGGWRLGATERYASGTPLSFSGAFGFPANTINNRPYITTYDGWRAPTVSGSFDPGKDRYFLPGTIANYNNGDIPTITQQGFFPLQPANMVGNMTRTNPKVRDFPLLNENVSLAKTIGFSEGKREIYLRFEAYNVLNRVQFGPPNTSLTSQNLGLVTTQANSARQLQMALKFVW